MALYLEGKPSVDTNALSPKEATQMSHEVKYIGMDVVPPLLLVGIEAEWPNASEPEWERLLLIPPLSSPLQSGIAETCGAP